MTAILGPVRTKTSSKSDLRKIESNLRHQYRLISKPAQLKHDDSFHRIQLHTPDGVDHLTIRTGYYDRSQ
jgi:hypothetical protein